jgi:hypothetical protein
MDDPNRSGYPPGEGHSYQNPSRERLTPPPLSPHPSHRRLITVLASVIGIMLVIVVIMAAVLFHSATSAPTTISPTSAAVAPTAAAPTATAPSASQQPTPTSAAPTDTPTASATLPCNVPVSTWTGGSSDWKALNGTLLNDGSNTNPNLGNGPTVVAPCQLGSVANYAVEAKIQVTSGRGCFGITVRGSTATNGWQGYMAGVGDCSYPWGNAYIGGPGYNSDSSNVKGSFDPGTNSHTYRVESNGNAIKLLIDGSPLLTLNDNRYLAGAQVGLWSSGVQLQVASFVVTAI